MNKLYQKENKLKHWFRRTYLNTLGATISVKGVIKTNIQLFSKCPFYMLCGYSVSNYTQKMIIFTTFYYNAFPMDVLDYAIVSFYMSPAHTYFLFYLEFCKLCARASEPLLLHVLWTCAQERPSQGSCCHVDRAPSPDEW